MFVGSLDVGGTLRPMCSNDDDTVAVAAASAAAVVVVVVVDDDDWSRFVVGTL